MRRDRCFLKDRSQEFRCFDNWVMAKWYDARKITCNLKSRAGAGTRCLRGASLAVALLGFACAGYA